MLLIPCQAEATKSGIEDHKHAKTSTGAVAEGSEIPIKKFQLVLRATAVLHSNNRKSLTFICSPLLEGFSQSQ